MQTECDGIGVKVGRGTSGNEYFAIESAFHADGLHDGKTPNAGHVQRRGGSYTFRDKRDKLFA